jgi:hypothetical protein
MTTHYIKLKEQFCDAVYFGDKLLRSARMTAVTRKAIISSFYLLTKQVIYLL